MDFDDDTNILEFELKSNDYALANQVINVNINGTSFTVTTNLNGKAYMTLTNYTPGQYTVNYSYLGTDKVSGINKTETIIISNSSKSSTDLDMDFDDDTNILEFDLNYNNKPLANKTIQVNINGTSFTLTTNTYGKAYMTLSNYTPGQYTVKYYLKEIILTIQVVELKVYILIMVQGLLVEYMVKTLQWFMDHLKITLENLLEMMETL